MAEWRTWGSNAMWVYSWARHCVNDGGRILRGEDFTFGLVIKYSICDANFVAVSMLMMTSFTDSRGP